MKRCLFAAVVITVQSSDLAGRSINTSADAMTDLAERLRREACFGRDCGAFRRPVDVSICVFAA